MELPLEARFRLRTIQSDIERITNLEKAKELLYRCFEYQISQEYLLKQIFKNMYQDDSQAQATNPPPNIKDYQNG